jgi:hypothetical protein
MSKSRILSSDRMSNSGYHANGKPNWWVRVGKGDSASFIEIDAVRGDQKLDVEVDLPVGTTVYIGAGKGTNKTIRETVETTMIERTAADGPAAWIAWHKARYELQATQDQAKVFNLSVQIGTFPIGSTHTRAEIQAERLAEIARLEASLPTRAKLLTERATLVARLAEIDAELAK